MSINACQHRNSMTNKRFQNTYRPIYWESSARNLLRRTRRSLSVWMRRLRWAKTADCWDSLNCTACMTPPWATWTLKAGSASIKDADGLTFFIISSDSVEIDSRDAGPGRAPEPDSTKKSMTSKGADNDCGDNNIERGASNTLTVACDSPIGMPSN